MKMTIMGEQFHEQFHSYDVSDVIKVYLFPSSRLLSRSSVRSSPNHFTTMYLQQRIDVIAGLHGVDGICRLLVILLLI